MIHKIRTVREWLKRLEAQKPKLAEEKKPRRAKKEKAPEPENVFEEVE
jgi:hypothetical protein